MATTSGSAPRAKADDANLRETLAFMLTGVAKESSPPARIRAVFSLLRAGPSFPERLYRSNCEVAVRTADRLGLPRGVQLGLDTIYARPDGKGLPLGQGDEIAVPARYAQVAGQAILFHDLGGPDLATKTIQRRAGTALDPTIADAFRRHGPSLLAEIDASDPFVAVLDAEPEPRLRIPKAHLEGAARVFADVTDLKSPWLHGHSTGVAALANAASRERGLSNDESARICLVGYLHDLGRVGVPSGIWDKPGSLTSGEWEQVRLHPYHSERILARSSALRALAPLAGMHHERLDGSGYHRGISGNAIPVDARVLATADTYDTRTHDRPHHPARSPEEAASELQTKADQGAFDADIVRALLYAAGHAPAPVRHVWPAGLTDREVQVLQLASRGMPSREIGETLSISPKTADHHIQHIYDKIGVSTRASAALFAMEHDLINASDPEK